MTAAGLQGVKLLPPTAARTSYSAAPRFKGADSRNVLAPASYPICPVKALTPHATSTTRVLDPKGRLVAQSQHFERQRSIDALALHGGNQTQAAEHLGISRRTPGDAAQPVRTAAPAKAR
jgi:transcriptional regulator with GAF, ATPase, and Fis domain